MKNVLAILAIGGFCLQGLSTLYNTFQFWPRDGFLAVIGHIGTSAGHFAGSAAGVFLAIAYLGMTPLHVTAWFGHKELTELLLAKGADVNAMADGGLTPLHTAALGGYKEIAELLIAKGADVNAIGPDGKTPRDWATHPDNPNASAETANLLRKHGGKTGEELKAAAN